MALNKPIKCVFDTDAGTDDAQAILMALASPLVEMVGFTVVHGNTDMRQAAVNVLRLLQLTGCTQIPVFLGSGNSLFGDIKEYGYFHGKDGLGDMANPEPVDESRIQKESAVSALHRLSKQYEGELSLIAIGPLTNIATAIRTDPTFGSRLKQCHIMGGNYHGKGNSEIVCAEFNFFCDPEAAQIVLNQLSCPITLVGWEVCMENNFTWDMHKSLRQIDTRIGRFFKEMEEEVMKRWTLYIPCDEYAVGALLNPKGIVLESKDVYATVELKGEYTRGQVVVDWSGALKRNCNVTLVTKVSSTELCQMIKNAMEWK